MNPIDDLEGRLSRMPLQSAPKEWRNEILASATAIQRRRTSDRSWLRELFWPHPVAWASMAAAWMAIGALHLANLSGSSKSAASNVEIALTPANASNLLRAEQTFAAVLLEESAEPEQKPQPRPPAPRSEVRPWIPKSG